MVAARPVSARFAHHLSLQSINRTSTSLPHPALMPASSRPSPRRLPAVPVGPRAPASFRPSASAVPATSATPSPSDAPRAIRPGPRATAFHATPPAPVPPAAACTVDSNPAGAGVRGPRPKPWQSSGATTPPAEASAASTVFCPAFTVSPASLAPPAVARALPPPPPPSGAEVTQTGVDDACVDDPPPPPYSAASIPVVDLPQPVYNRPSGAIATPSRSIGLEGLFERIDWIIEDMQPWFPGHAQRRELPASEW